MTQSFNRREFLKRGGGAAALPLVASPLLARGVHHGSDVLRVGLVGCGGRGGGAAAQALQADPGCRLVAMGDAFADRMEGCFQGLKEAFPDQVLVDEEHKFAGLDAYQKVLDSELDVVLLATPPGFRPAHIAAAVDAGVHIFAEKPIAVDAPGVRSVLESARRAQEKGLALASGFCWRASYPERGIYGQIAEGRLGEIRTVYGTYLTGPLWYHPRKENWTEAEYQLRNWYYYTYLSGDHIVEQAVHTIDKIAWAMQDEAPVQCTAMGGREVRVDEKWGNIYDHFSVVYEYANGALGILLCRQIPGCSNDNSDRVLGSKGIARINGWTGLHSIEGENPWQYAGPRNNMYQTEHDELFASIRRGEPINQGVSMAKSTMLAIMGRMSAYTGKTLTWDQVMNSQESLMPENMAWGDMPRPALAVPGKTPFV
ncbi:MAG: gfo/Idh/MocA family oxidoreductase [Planctomycetota bacterium]|nr:MAG: gfo/Idh/MocA family oxidoreductase [Planctomycetota bacterium]